MLKLKLLCLFTFIYAGNMFAGDETRSNRAYANQFVPGAFLETRDDKYTGFSSGPPGFTNYSNRGVVEFGLDEDKHMILPQRKYCAKFDVTVTDFNHVTTVFTNQELDINYNPYEQTRYKDKAQLVFPNAYRLTVTNVKIYACSLGTSNCAACGSSVYTGVEVYMQAEITTTRLYDFTFASTFVTGDLRDTLLVPSNELRIDWNYLKGAEEYELEYTFVDDYSATLGTFLANTALFYDLEHDATRISTTHNQYKIPLTYEHGYIIYRVKPIGRSATNERIEGPWFGAAASGAIPTTYARLIAAHNADAFNWEGVKTFAENGKTGTGISFSDALGSKRQSLARLNTDQKTIAQSTLYDFYGRPAITILPSPVTGLDLKYQFNLNKYAGAEFEKSDFDLVLTSNVCIAAGIPMDVTNSTGAAKYYSPQNPNQQGYQGYVPDAKALPYTQVKLKPDGTGRPISQTMPGITHQLGSGKEVKYFYSKPTQIELDRLFGCEAPRANQCFKNYVQDPHGQLSTTYIDQNGRTIATALLGNSPFNVDSLDGLPTSEIFPENFNKPSINISDPANRCLEVNTTFFVAELNSPQAFLYQTTLGEFGSSCLTGLCFDCLYDLEISIKNECGEEMFDYDSNPLTNPPYKEIIGGVPPYAPGSCGGSTSKVVTGSTLNTPITIPFQKVGTYTLYKKICVSDAPMQDYTQAFIDKQTCVDPCFYVDSIIGTKDFSNCSPQSCQDCLNSISAYTNYITSPAYRSLFDDKGNLLDPSYQGTMATVPTPQQLSQWQENCASLCHPANTCEKYEQKLLADFYPGTGQFAETNPTASGWSGSILNAGNTLFSGYNWTSPTLYQAANGAGDLVQINGTNYAPQSLSKPDFILNFRKSWAKAFLSRHPENCKLYFYCNVVGASMDFDERMNNIWHYDTVCATSGLIYPTGSLPGSVNYPPASSCAAPDVDPIFTSLSANTLVSDLKNELINDLYSNTGQSIYDYVTGVFYTSPPSGYKFGQDECTRDAMWTMFKKIYLTKKQALYKALYADYLSSPSSYGYSGACPVSFPSQYSSHFPNWADSTDKYIPGSPSTSSLLDNITASNNGASASAVGANIAAANSATIAAACASNCASYLSLWHMNLNTACPAYSGAGSITQNKILAAMQGICEKGCDINNPDGASTAPTGSPFLIMPGSIAVNNFQDVLDYYLPGNGCSANVVLYPQPYPYNAGPSSMNNNGLGSCQCDQLLKISSDFQTMQSSSTLPAGVTEEWQLFRKVYGYDLKEYYALKCFCSSAIAADPGNSPWSPGLTWSTTQLNELPNYPVAINPNFSCPNCTKCTDVVTAINALVLPSSNSYSGVLNKIRNDSVNTYYALAVLNNQFGEHSLSFYFNLYDDCQSFNSTGAQALTFQNNISPEALDLFGWLNQLVENKNLSKTTRAMSLCQDDKYYLSGIYGGVLPTISALTYNSGISGNTLNFTVQNLSSVTQLAVSLTLPALYTGTWSGLLQLSNFVAWCPTPAAGPNYKFKVEATDANFNTVLIEGQVTNLAFPICNLSSGTSPVPAVCPAKPKAKNACAIEVFNNALTQGRALFDNKTQSLAADFQEEYKNACFASINETFYRNYKFTREYQYTLYYYDEAGNLARTVAPAGVTPITLAAMSGAELPLTSGMYPLHNPASVGVAQKYVSDYHYNAYGLPVQESTIDGGTTKYLYDLTGRIIASQNAKQAAVSGNYVYSYTLYDVIGRITEVGEMTTATNLFATPNVNSMAYASFVTTVGTATKRQVTRTYYDSYNNTSPSSNAGSYFVISANTLQNLRNRVVCVTYSEPSTAYPYDHATWYSYDEHGNVNFLVQENNLIPNPMSGFQNGYDMQFKRIDYEYDLISGNVLRASYQKGHADHLSHKYFYDGDNRLHEVFTSKDEINWDRDAKYFYYEHGPLARVERADKQVQGEDFYYTIQGWLKGVNSDMLQINNDAGKDGAANNAYLSNYNKIHAYFAKDAMSFALNYFNNTAALSTNIDYTAIKNNNFNSTSDINPNSSLANLYSGTAPFYLDNAGTGHGPSLFNGNISSMVTSFIDKDNSNTIADNTAFPQITAYRYDQLQRVKSMRAHRGLAGNAWTTPVSGTNYDDSYRMAFNYDKNGNLLKLFRNGAAPSGPGLKTTATLGMDDLTYFYKTISNSATGNSNQLYGISDLATTSTYADDVDGPTSVGAYSSGTARYDYDEIGNLKKDAGEYIASIEWTVDRKVQKINRDATAMLATGTGPGSVFLPDIEYEYNAMRQRVTKIVKPRNPITRVLIPATDWIYTYYVYDASGNVMAVYDRKPEVIGENVYDMVKLSENHIYGSSRLALSRPDDPLAANWGYKWTPCGAPGGEINCRTISSGPGTYVYPTPFSATPWYKTARNLGYKEFELDNHLGNVIATVSDRKIVITVCPNEFLRDFNEGSSIGINTSNSNKSIVSDKLRVTPTGLNANVNFTFATTAYDAVNISFDFSHGNSTVADSVKATAYPYNSYSNSYGHAYSSVMLSADGNYNLAFTGPVSGSGYDGLYFEFSTRSGTTSPHYFELDNIALGRAGNGAPNTAPCSTYVQLFMGYFPDLLMHTDYYAFGQQMPARTWVYSNYRYGFNGHEHDNEVFEGADGTYYRMYDSRIGRWFSKDPYTFPDESPYAAMGGNPIAYSDPLGDKITYGSIKDWARTQFKRITDKEFRKEFKALKEEYSGEFIDENGKGTGREKELHIITGGKKYGTLDEAVSNHSITHGKANDGQDYLRYNGNIDKIAISEQRSGVAYIGGNQELMVPPDMKTYNFHYYLRASASLGSEFNWKITTSYIDNGLFANSSFSSPKNSIQTYLNISLQNINKNVEGGDGDPRTGRAPTYSSDHVLGWNSAMVVYKIEAMGLPKIYTVERRIFGGYRNKKVLSDYSGRIDKILKKSMSISVQKVD